MRSVVVSMCDSCGDARDTAALREMRVHGTNAPKHSSVPLDRPPGRLRLPAGQSTRCRSCNKLFEDWCIRSRNDRYYCCEACAQVGCEIDFTVVANSA
jgi:hypothetical protein